MSFSACCVDREWLLGVFGPTNIMQVQGNIFVLEERIIVETAPLDLLEKGADVPAVQHL